MTVAGITISRRDAAIALVAALGVVLFVVAAASIHDVGFPLDDAWIHQTYARNLAEHGEWALVPGEESVASTSPLYTVLLSVGYLVGLDFFVWAFVLGAAALVAASLIGSRLSRRLFPEFKSGPLWAGLAIATTWHLVWAAASGMETMLFGTLSLLVVWLVWRQADRFATQEQANGVFWHGSVLGLVGAALTLTRPEGVGLVGLTGLLMLLAWPAGFDRDGLKMYMAWAVGVAAGWLIGVLPYVLLNLDIEGTLLPNTSAAKQAEYASLREQFILRRYGRMLLQLLVGGQIVLIPGMLAGGAELVRRARSDRRRIIFLLPLVWAFADLTVYALRLPVTYQHARYVIPVLPHLILVGVGGTYVLVRRSRRSLMGRVLSRSLALSAVVIVPGFFVIGARQYGADVRIINTEMVDTAQWVADNVPPEDLLAVHDIGALGYYAPRPILDLAGLISPEVVPIIRDGDALMRLMCERDVRYLMVFPDQLLVPEDDPRLGNGPVFVTSAPYALEAGGGNMAVYQLAWGDACY